MRARGRAGAGAAFDLEGSLSGGGEINWARSPDRDLGEINWARSLAALAALAADGDGDRERFIRSNCAAAESRSGGGDCDRTRGWGCAKAAFHSARSMRPSPLRSIAEKRSAGGELSEGT